MNSVDPVMSAIAGTRDAERLVATIREGCAPADLLLEAFEAIRVTGDAERLRAMLRRCQKALEAIQ